LKPVVRSGSCEDGIAGIGAVFLSIKDIYIYIYPAISRLSIEKRARTFAFSWRPIDRSFGADSQVFLSQSKVKEEGVRADQDGIMHLRETNLFSSWSTLNTKHFLF